MPTIYKRFKKPVKPVLHQQQQVDTIALWESCSSYSPQLIFTLGVNSRSSWGPSALLQEGVKVQTEPKATQQMLCPQAPLPLTASSWDDLQASRGSHGSKL